MEDSGTSHESKMNGSYYFSLIEIYFIIPSTRIK